MSNFDESLIEMKNIKFLIAGFSLLVFTVLLAQNAQESLQKGNEKLKKGDYNGAIAEYNEAIKENPNMSEAYQKRGKSRRMIGNLNGAMEDYNTALRVNANSMNSYLGRAQTFFKSGNFEAAIRDYNIFISQNPSSKHLADIYYNRGLAKIKLKDYEGALEDFNQVLKIQENDVKALVNRGYILYQKNEIRPACNDWVKAKNLGNEKAIRNANRACQCCM